MNEGEQLCSTNQKPYYYAYINCSILEVYSYFFLILMNKILSFLNQRYYSKDRDRNMEIFLSLCYYYIERVINCEMWCICIINSFKSIQKYRNKAKKMVI